MASGTQNLPRIKLHAKGTHRCLTGHPWVFDGEFAGPDDIEPGSEVDVLGPNNRFVGRGYYNPASKITVRLFSRTMDEHLDADFFRSRLQAARARRAPFYRDDEPQRLVFSEGDRLPGLVADRYGDTIVFELLTLGMAARRDLIVAALAEAFAPRSIVERADATAGAREKMPLAGGPVFGPAPDEIALVLDGVRCGLDPTAGQKTGLYLDQRWNWRRFAEFARGGDVLDAFAYHGHFGLYAAAAGAKSVTVIESSPVAAERIAANAALNGVTLETLVENAFDALRRLESEGRRFTLISLDPPSFTRGPARGGASYRGYKEINRRALRLLAPGGVLFTSSCSFHTSREDFRAMLADAARDARREVRLIELRGAAPDHPVALDTPETDYLKCLVARAE